MPELLSEPPQFVASVDLGDRLLRARGGIRHGQELGDLDRRLLDGLLDTARLLDVDDHGPALGMPGTAMRCLSTMTAA